MIWDVVFFFSSRRRHTRWTGDWSSDVCSSDLEHAARGHDAEELALVLLAREDELGGNDAVAQAALLAVHVEQEQVERGDRSEERRVGKESSSWTCLPEIEPSRGNSFINTMKNI